MSITEKRVNFKEIEKKTYRKVCEYGCRMLKEMLEELDLELSESRDKKMYRHKGKRKAVIKTVMGEVEYERAVYEVKDESSVKKFVYLLDEELGIDGSGFFSGMLSEYIVNASCENSYRNAARTVTELTGQSISHTAAWNVVQELGERVDEQEKIQAKEADSFQGKGQIESKVLFEEQDGIWLKLQGKSRKTYGASKEMKLAIAYDGAEKVGKDRYKLTNKVACANFESVDKFIKRKEGIIANSYRVDEIEKRFLNGDGAEWIKRSIIDEDTYFQLDPYHRNKAIISHVQDGRKRKVLFGLLKEGRTDDLLECIEAYINCSENEREIKELTELYTYFESNKSGLIEIHNRGMAIPAPICNKQYRHLGCMESNIFSIIGNRMKGRRACWSIEGGNNLSRMLCLKMTGRLSNVLSAITQITLPEKYSEIKEKTFSAGRIPMTVGKGYNGYRQSGAFPAVASYQFLRDIATGVFKA